MRMRVRKEGWVENGQRGIVRDVFILAKAIRIGTFKLRANWAEHEALMSVSKFELDEQEDDSLAEIVVGNIRIVRGVHGLGYLSLDLTHTSGEKEVDHEFLEYDLVSSLGWFPFVNDVAHMAANSVKENGAGRDIEFVEDGAIREVSAWDGHAIFEAELNQSLPQPFHHRYSVLSGE
ncbi:hypothetical protein VNO78_19905 [Psophocarpus tetragonolobus]|uniref:Uncharacterized protein n=1 Tax=Psophocarpus tetragonolobus TaxID=3891 RepID=A0AAN9S8G4_PSOTE